MRNTLFLLLSLFVVNGHSQPEVDRLLANEEPPSGVVFEIVESDDDALDWALPLVTRLAEQLRNRFPGLSIAVVSHGKEQFALLSDADDTAPHQGAQRLQADGIDVHVCAIHASWYGHTPEDFPGFIDVAASGPAQIAAYEQLGFEIIHLQEGD